MSYFTVARCSTVSRHFLEGFGCYLWVLARCFVSDNRAARISSYEAVAIIMIIDKSLAWGALHANPCSCIKRVVSV